MSREQVIEDLQFAKNLAEQGIDAPLVGGRFGLLWGALLLLTLTGHWAILAGIVAVELNYLFYLWLGFAITGVAGSVALDHSLRGKPGLASVGNRVEHAVWKFFGATMFVCFSGLAAAIGLGKAAHPMLDFVIGIGFAGQGMAYGTLSHITGRSWLLGVAVGCFAIAIVCFALYATTTLYLVAALGVFFTSVVPGLIQLRHEPPDVG